MAINRALMNRQMYNMGGPSRPRQMYDMGGSSLQAGAPDLRLTGVHPTYSQARKKRMNMAGGGIMGSNSGSMLVAPTADGSRPGYWGIPSWDSIKKIGQTIIPGGDPGYVNLYGGESGQGNSVYDTIKKIGQTIVPGGETGFFDMYNIGGANAEQPEGSTPPYIPGDDPYKGGGIYDYGTEDEDTGNPLFNTLKKIGQTIVPGGDPGYFNLYGNQEPDTTNMTPEQKAQLEIEKYKRRNLNADFLKAMGIGTAAGAYADSQPKDKLAADNTGMDIAAITAAAQGTDEQAKAAGLNFLPDQITRAAEGGRIGYTGGGGVHDFNLSDLNLLKANKYNPSEVAKWKDKGKGLLNTLRTTGHAEGGRIGYGNGTPDPIMPEQFLNNVDEIIEAYMKSTEGKYFLKDEISRGKNMDQIINDLRKEMNKQKLPMDSNDPGFTIPGPPQSPNATPIPEGMMINPMRTMEFRDVNQNGIPDRDEGIYSRDGDFVPKKDSLNIDPGFTIPRVTRAEGGLMDLGGNEMDLRAEGGFIPIGGKEKADDVPARLSKNEFVFTADAVRNAGGGNIDEGAQVMERLMKSLEQGGQVSEESQGLDGAREMFETSQRLEKRII